MFGALHDWQVPFICQWTDRHFYWLKSLALPVVMNMRNAM